jgi:hypothetical protein
VWGGQSFSEWLWNVAFDGIASTAIATVVAVYFVRRTLRHDRELAAIALTAQRRSDRESAFEASCQRVLDQTKEMFGGTLSLPDFMRWRNDLFHLAIGVPVEEPLLAEILKALHDVSAEMRTDRALRANVVSTLWSALAKRLAVPIYFLAVDSEVGEDAIATIRRGEAYNFN